MSDDHATRIQALEFQHVAISEKVKRQEAEMQLLKSGHNEQSRQLALIEQLVNNVNEWTKRSDKRTEERNGWLIKFIIGAFLTAILTWIFKGGLTIV